MSARARWFDAMALMRSPSVLEIGTRGWDGHPPRHHRAELVARNPSASWVGVDCLGGPGVDVVADIHSLSGVFQPGQFDAAIMASVLEHVRRPWVAAKELAAVIRPGGILLVQTHQTFPVHGYPSDYWRFTREALAEVFALDHGWRVIESEYTYPAKVVPLSNEVHATNWNFLADAWLNVEAMCERA